jgi:ATP-dependent protease ClpP protease subunit
MPVDMARLRNLASALQQRTEASHQQRDAHGRSWYRIEATNQAESAEIYLYDIIGDWGVTAGEFVNELRSVRALRIDMHINCEGGEIFDGLAIYEAIRQHPAYVRGLVDGIAASSASFILQAADERIVAERGRVMVHDGHGLVIGNAADMREMADLLDDLSDNIADIYADRSGRGTRKSWRNAMLGPNRASDGTWYDANAAVEAGLADRVGDRAASAGNTAPRQSRNERSDTDAADRRPARDREAAPSLASWQPGSLLAGFREATAPDPEPLAWNPSELLKSIKEAGT